MCLHHCWGRTLKDAFNRYNSLAGRRVDFVWGFDAQGMWVEVEVEKLLGLNDKRGIAEYGLDKFTEKCIERVNYFKNMQTEQSKRLGQLGDWDRSYITNSDTNITAIWNFLKVCNAKGMLKQSYKTMPWCPRCGTSLSEHEMSGSYKERTHKAVFVKAKLTGAKERILVWTTTPWTLPANVAIAVNPKLTYCKCTVKSEDNLIIVCEDTLKILRDDLVKVITKVKGTDLIGREYEPFLPLKKQKFIHKIVAWDAVAAAEGSGLVHIAPGCGAEDFELGKSLGLPQIVPVGEDGVFGTDFEWLTGFNTATAEDIIFAKLKEKDTYYYSHNYTHNYPFCWRCKTDVIFRLVSGFDIATDGVRKDLLAAADTVNWSPEFMGKSMRQWLTDMGDWNISRRRFYGLPLPFYPCSCGHFNIIGSREELRSRAVDKSAADEIPHLHRPYIDAVKITCEKCGRAVSRTPEVGDCWLDAGIAPFSTKPKGEHIADMVLEMKEQIRLWFYAQLFLSVVLTGEAPYKNVVGYSTMVDEDGKKFSKTGPRKISIEDAVSKYGADVLRWAFASAAPNLDMRFGDSTAEDAKRKLLSVWNAFVFYTTYAAIDKPDVKNYRPADLTPTDIWLVQRTNGYVKATRREYEQFRIHNVVKLTEAFVEDISNFYIRVNRRRFWRNAQDANKLNAYWCLYNALRSIIIVITPITPSYAEYLWQNLVGGGLVMLADYPDEIKIGKYEDICPKVDFVKTVISLGLTLRAENKIAVKQPLAKLFVKSSNGGKEALELFSNLIKDQVNVKDVEIVTDDNKFNTPYLVIDFKKAGSVLKHEIQVLKTVLEGLDEHETGKAVAQFDAGGKVDIDKFKGLSADLFERKLLPKAGFVITADGDTTVVLDTAITPELLIEGISREIVRAVQVERADMGLDIQDRIMLTIYTADNTVRSAIEKYKDRICEETLAAGLRTASNKGKTVIINNQDVTIAVVKAK
jgi:isoleucyl-tRNA synthetase